MSHVSECKLNILTGKCSCAKRTDYQIEVRDKLADHYHSIAGDPDVRMTLKEWAEYLQGWAHDEKLGLGIPNATMARLCRNAVGL